MDFKNITLDGKPIQTRFSKVFPAKTNIGNEEIKIVVKRQLQRTTHQNQSLEREIENLSKVFGDRFVKLLGHSEDKKEIYLERIEGKDVQSYFEEEGPQKGDTLYPLIREMGQSILELHSPQKNREGYIHYDLSGGNFMITKEKEIKLIDFATSFPQSDIPEKFFISSPGAIGYMSPEKINKDPKKGKQSDIYELGAVTYSLISGAPPLEDLREELNYYSNPGRVKRRIFEFKIENVSSENKHLDNLVMSCLEKNPDNRPTAQEFVSTIENYC